ncbi:MAG: DUF2130 domain-containing protein [Terracidiphilus sp.]|jgi:hypothetical protein
MPLQSGQTSEFKLPSHLQLGLESCPTCGQAIPPDKLEEISGRIAARERERTLAISAQLNMQYAADKARAETKAKADLEAERQQSALREVRAREEAQKGAEKLVREAGAKVREAEAKVLTLTVQHASAMETGLNEQREIMEQAREDAVNAEKARAFEDNQKLSTKVNDLQRALDKKTNEELGEGAEINIFEALKAEFKDDRIERIPKGAPGADVRHIVMLRGQECGTILYDSKNHNQWRVEHATKLRKDQLAEKADHAILSTHKFPQGARQLHILDGVLLANPARVVAVAIVIRQHLLQLHTLRVSKVERESKTAALYEFIISARCKQLLDRIDQRAGGLLELQDKEIRWHEKQWEHQGTAIRAIQKAKGDLASEVDSIIGTSDDLGISEAS